MADVFTKAKRSAVMSLIRSRGNRETELRLIALMREHRITGWRRNARIFGKPDFVFPAAKLAVFVDGCFWHGCPQHASMPKNNSAFWAKKLASNKVRDRLVTRTLRKTGWRVLRIWEHDLRAKNQPNCLKRLHRLINSAAMSLPRSTGAKTNPARKSVGVNFLRSQSRLCSIGESTRTNRSGNCKTESSARASSR